MGTRHYIRIRVLNDSDLDFAETLRAATGWNQTRDDWRLLLRLEPTGCFLAEWNHQPAGTITTTRLGSSFAWIGMLLVQQSFRGRGIGRMLFQHALAYLLERGIRAVKLDATPLGEPLYRLDGFHAQVPLTRWHREQPLGRRAGTGGPCNTSTIDPARLGRAIELDAVVFGANRQNLLQSIVTRPNTVLQTNRSGFGVIRPGAKAAYLGPVIATNPHSAGTLIAALLAASPQLQVYWDFPDQNHSAKFLAEQFGFQPRRSLTRMAYGSWPSTKIDWQYAIADPAWG